MSLRGMFLFIIRLALMGLLGGLIVVLETYLLIGFFELLEKVI